MGFIMASSALQILTFFMVLNYICFVSHIGVDGFILRSASFRTTTSTSEVLWKSHTTRKLNQHYGIPKLFRWLVDLYPIVIESVGEGLTSSSMKVDNFYLDMNGIIHTCTHSNNDKIVELNEKEMFQRIFAYTDRLYKLVNPSMLMFLAVDGVAPRAKMNQQRSRRFRSSKEQEVLLADYVSKEGKMPEVQSFDSNCITPGTEFMFRLGIAFRRWIEYKMETDPFWKMGAEVVFSGPDVPGEGEHKVMDMIRKLQAQEGYSIGSLRHCMYGLDADLIMLSLVTHEPFFVLLREKISRRKQNKDATTFSPEDFELLEISILRKMMKQHFRRLAMALSKSEAGGGSRASDEERDGDVSSYSFDDDTENIKGMSPADAGAIPTILQDKHIKSRPFSRAWTSEFSLERIIDDFVFMCFFVGNDFLPCLPHLDIADGSLNLMMNTYLELSPVLGGYLTSKTDIHLPRLELFVQEIGRREPLYFLQRSIDEKDPGFATEGYKEHYYKVKFGIDYSDKEAIRTIVKSYLAGLAWVLSYYHEGCCSWTWYYPYLYAPLATDLFELGDISLEFEQGKPFTPLLQLLSVLPPQSGSFLPKSYENIMTAPTSPLAPYYPRDFEVDANGKKNAWECIVRIPFINETMLVDAVCEIDHKNVLTQSERMRNIIGVEHRFPPPFPKKTNNASLKGASAEGKGGPASRQRPVDLKDGGKWGNALLDDRSRGGGGGYRGGGGSGGRPSGGGGRPGQGGGLGGGPQSSTSSGRRAWGPGPEGQRLGSASPKPSR